MVRVQISKNNGFLEYKEAEVDIPTEEEGKLSIEDVKLRWAHAIYAEEDLFTLEGPHEIKLYHMPLGHDVDLLKPSQLHEWISTPSSQWVLDIFARPLITSSIGGAINIDTTTTDSPRLVITRANATPKVAARATARHPFSRRDPHWHVGTWVPQLNTSLTTPRRDSNTSTGSATSFIGGIMGTRGHLQTEYEDILQTTFRAQETLRKFASIGKPVTTHSIQTTLLPLAMACPSAISRHGPNVLYQGVYNLVDAELQRGFVQAVRIWFSFDNEHTVEVAKRDGSLGLKPVRQQDGWIVVQAVPGSPCALAGMPDDEVFLTHVNGVDVSPPQCPASADKARQSNGNVSWAGNVVPLVEPCDVCVFTYF
ncbi:hypothetical protein, variant [Aphanomyces astaci]|uniref:PDZ domain-containing protein n=1 Tax=Aphanomyces astaci TaxID=112090 RepID=W4G3G3_APHAT|nr:hypothetical protein, variant [Aphanomyces astaci]ETV73559.1 hypothetical protein, variant [Aphanomyces astaci]|eukprot:XP_009836985.1 hypothetical protein, variant [Aphanomyces astaci]